MKKLDIDVVAERVAQNTHHKRQQNNAIIKAVHSNSGVTMRQKRLQAWLTKVKDGNLTHT